MQSASGKDVLVSKIRVEREHRHESRDAYYRNDFLSWRLHLLYDVGEPMPFKPKKGHKKN